MENKDLLFIEEKLENLKWNEKKKKFSFSLFAGNLIQELSVYSWEDIEEVAENVRGYSYTQLVALATLLGQTIF